MLISANGRKKEPLHLIDIFFGRFIDIPNDYSGGDNATGQSRPPL